ncbi:cyclic GMP-AMP synthase [Ctenodactylus gundi]
MDAGRARARARPAAAPPAPRPRPPATPAAPRASAAAAPGARPGAGRCEPAPPPQPGARARRASPRAPAEGPEPRAPRAAPGARRRSRRERGAGDPGPLARPAAPASCGWRPRAVLDRLRLSRPEISAAAEVVNRLVDHLQRRLQSCESEFRGVSQLRAGSYYEHVKISAPNEFDVMFKLKVSRVDLEEYSNSGAHYLVRFKRNPKGNPLSQFLEKEILSASKMLSAFRNIIKEEIKNLKDIDVIMERKKPGSPAVTLLIRKPKEISVDVILALEPEGSWPASTQFGLPIECWLGRKVRQELRLQPFYLVPKHAKDGSGFQEETWRLSFSHVEKDILNNHGESKTCCEANGVKCCRKDCLKLMKYLLEQLKKKFEKRKEMCKFCSYHMKTAFFHICTQYPGDLEWDPRDLHLCFDKCVLFLLECLREETLKHFFIPGVNLFSKDHIDKPSKEFLLKQIEYERNNGFPVFGEF